MFIESAPQWKEILPSMYTDIIVDISCTIQENYQIDYQFD